MALFDRFRRNTEQQIEKAAPPLPAGTTAIQFTPEQLNQIAQSAMGIGIFNPLPRNQNLAGIPFGPSLPLTPAAINPVNSDGRTAPRRYEYPVAWNVFVTEQRLVPWKVLRASAEQIDILRRCIEVLKSKIASMDWDIVLSESASELIATENTGSYLRALADARRELNPEIARIRSFWQMPDRVNGLIFADWLSMLLEELLVLDAGAIYPHPTVGGELHSFEILDGSTIKPLLDDRGMRPLPPFPAYQQILYGFPRGEFTATSDDENFDGSFASDELIYLVKNRRTWTPYGYSPVERALPLADIYLRRQQWLRSEFTNGVSPDMLFKTDPQYGGTPDLLKAWETIFNDEMAGQTEARRGAKLIPSGFEPVDLSGRSEKFSATLDEYLIKGITGHFGVMPSEIGFTPNTGLGGAGFQEGEAETSSVIGVGPLTQWLGAMLSDLSYKFLGMPRELEFRFDGGRTSTSEADARRRTVEVAGGMRTVNEARAEMGLTLIDSPLADMTMVEGMPSFISPEGIISGTSTIGVTDEGVAEPRVQELASENVPADAVTEDGSVDAEAIPPTTDQKSLQREEIAAFIKWAAKGKRGREFSFKHIDSISADALNEAAASGNIEEVRSVASVVVPF